MSHLGIHWRWWIYFTAIWLQEIFAGSIRWEWLMASSRLLNLTTCSLPSNNLVSDVCPCQKVSDSDGNTKNVVVDPDKHWIYEGQSMFWLYWDESQLADSGVTIILSRTCIRILISSEFTFINLILEMPVQHYGTDFLRELALFSRIKNPETFFSRSPI